MESSWFRNWEKLQRREKVCRKRLELKNCSSQVTSLGFRFFNSGIMGYTVLPVNSVISCLAPDSGIQVNFIPAVPSRPFPQTPYINMIVPISQGQTTTHLTQFPTSPVSGNPF